MLQRWKSTSQLTTLDKEWNERATVPRYKSGDIIQKMVDNEINNYFHQNKFKRADFRKKKKDSLVVQVIGKIENDRQIRILERELEKEKRQVGKLERSRSEIKKLELRRKKVRESKARKGGVQNISHEHAWEKFKLTNEEKEELAKVRRRICPERKSQPKRSGKKKWKRKASWDRKKRSKLKKKKEIKKVRSFLSGRK